MICSQIQHCCRPS